MELSLKSNLNSYKRILVTGGSGFIGGYMVKTLLKETNCYIANFDKLGYASDNKIIDDFIETQPNEEKILFLSRYKFFEGNLNKKLVLEDVFNTFKPNLVFHFAAESHVDRSIDNPDNFIDSNIIGTYNLLEVIRKCNSEKNLSIKLIHISTDEVFGSAKYPTKFQENSPYNPRSPYSASKASSDHLVSAWFHTYGVKSIITNCGNNYGPWQFPEKLIPLSILKALNNEDIPIYGDGKNIRDWIFVQDHINALLYVATNGEIGNRYCIGASNEITNINLIIKICKILDKLITNKTSHENLIKFVKDRSGHDKRYSIDSLLISKLGWKPLTSLDEGLDITINWYLSNLDWCNNIKQKSNFTGERLGISN